MADTEPLQIAIDARWIFAEISGIGAYTRELILHLARRDPCNAYTLFFSDAAVIERTRSELGLERFANVRIERLGWDVFSLRSQVLLPAVLRRLRIDVYHSTNYLFPFAAFPRSGRGRIGCVATIHDVIPMLFPDHAPRSRKARLFPLYVRVMLEAGRRAHAIVTDSRASARDVLRCLRIPAANAGKVRAIHCGVSNRFTPGPAFVPPGRRDPARVRRLLYVGRCDPYKNLDTLLRAMAQIRPRLPFGIELTIAGSPDPRYPEAPRLARELGLEPAVRWAGYLSDSDLVEAYRAADLLVHPSRYEGFGLQVLEAMACGVPVVCSNAASLPEVAGDAAALVDPDDVSGMAARIAGVLRDPAEAERMSVLGLRRAAEFAWDRTAGETLAVYADVAARRNAQ